jgi:hypothetical protein
MRESCYRISKDFRKIVMESTTVIHEEELEGVKDRFRKLVEPSIIYDSFFGNVLRNIFETAEVYK